MSLTSFRDTFLDPPGLSAFFWTILCSSYPVRFLQSVYQRTAHRVFIYPMCFLPLEIRNSKVRSLLHVQQLDHS